MICVFVVPICSQAYFKTNQNGAPFEPDINPRNCDQSNSITSIGIYERTEQSEKRFGVNDDYPPSCSRFAPLDEIAVNEAVPLRFWSALPVDNQVSQLIYANLKLKQLVDEYARLQGQMHFTGSTSSFGRSHSQAVLNSHRKNEFISLFRTKMTLEQDRQELAQLINNQGYALNSVKPSLNLRDAAGSDWVNGIIENDNSKLTSFLQAIREKDETDLLMADSGDAGEYTGNNSVNGKERKNIRRGATQPPKIFNMFAMVVHYILNNKLEVTFYLFVLSLLFFFLTVAIKH